MTAPLTHQTVAVSVKDAAAIRKRRRRAAAGGASDDCFTCSKRNVKCDRRRPYCSQCLEIGNECSGYKTQLTWGVGVASRGKLRGLSLPIAKAPPVSREAKKSPIARPRTNSNGTTVSTTPVRSPIDIPAASHASAPTTPAYPMASYDYLSMSHSNASPPLTQGSWSSVPYSPSIVHSPVGTPRYQRYPLQLSTDSLSSSVDTINSEADYMSQPYQREDIPFNHSPTMLYDGYPTQQSSPISQSPPTMLVLDHCRPPTSYPGLIFAPSEPSSSLHSHMDPFEPQLGHKMMRECGSLSVPEVDAYSTGCNSTGPVWSSSRSKEGGDDKVYQWPAFQASPSTDLIAKMPFFMDYYKITIAPSMVFIDGPHNPFRTHIMNLAVHSASLQHAICALSACNLRMKRRLSLGHDTRELSEKMMAEKQAVEIVGESKVDDQSLSEEIQHRNLAVHLLNQELNDSVRSCHDSVLATILLLCHYRMVESGVAKFHTQFAGVRKILEMRKSGTWGLSRDAKWMESLFTYFDAISASINDREAQLTPEPEGVSREVYFLPAGAENMVGCDRRLFRTISKLGRLNVLSQQCHLQRTSISMRAQDSIGGAVIRPSTAIEDEHHLFWKEWKEARQELQTWQFDALAIARSLPGSPTTNQVRDLEAVSEAFRYAALLYSERLANPNLPATHSNFQNLVSQVVYYATSLETSSAAEKFLLWPLFIAGSECINSLQQNIIRNKCRDIMNRSGYMNNLSALDVLEKLWSGEFKDEVKFQGYGKGPFNWTRCFGGPGAGVEWIMF